MLYKSIQPAAHLKHFIKDFLLLHFVFDKFAPVPIKPFPASTAQALVFYVRGNVTAFDLNQTDKVIDVTMYQSCSLLEGVITIVKTVLSR